MSNRTFVGAIHVALPKVFMEKVGGGVCIFMWRERPSMFRFMSRFSQFICFVISVNVGMSSDFMYGKSISPLLQ